jgi:hypothetical protein
VKKLRLLHAAKVVLLAIHQAYSLLARNANQGIMRVWDIAINVTGLV